MAKRKAGQLESTADDLVDRLRSLDTENSIWIAYKQKFTDADIDSYRAKYLRLREDLESNDFWLRYFFVKCLTAPGEAVPAGQLPEPNKAQMFEERMLGVQMEDRLAEVDRLLYGSRTVAPGDLVTWHFGAVAELLAYELNRVVEEERHLASLPPGPEHLLLKTQHQEHKTQLRQRSEDFRRAASLQAEVADVPRPSLRLLKPQLLFPHQPYRFVRRLGVGHLSEVWLAVETTSLECFAVRVTEHSLLHPKRPGLAHANLVKLYRTFSAESLHFQVVERCTFSVGMLATSQRLGLRQVYLLLVQLLEALTYLHSRGLAHCHLYPYSLFLTEDGRLKLGNLDWICEIDRPDRLVAQWSQHQAAQQRLRHTMELTEAADLQVSEELDMENVLLGFADRRVAASTVHAYLPPELASAAAARVANGGAPAGSTASLDLIALDCFMLGKCFEQLADLVENPLKACLDPEPSLRPSLAEIGAVVSAQLLEQ